MLSYLLLLYSQWREVVSLDRVSQTDTQLYLEIMHQPNNLSPSMPNSLANARVMENKRGDEQYASETENNDHE